LRIVVAGGGYAGLACLMELRRRMADAELILIDPGEDHLKITHLHETVRRPLRRFRRSYMELGKRIGFDHYRHALDCNKLADFAAESAIDIDGHRLSFDFLVIATGAKPPSLSKSAQVYDRDDLREQDAGDLVSLFLGDETRPRELSVVGGGPSGIQILFELADCIEASRQPIKLRLVDREAKLLGDYPSKLGDYVQDKLVSAGIEYLPQTEYVSSDEDTLQFRDVSTGENLVVQSGLTFLFPGVSPSPCALNSDRYGRVEGYESIFGAGDCARFDSRGDDQLTAQIAVRQGKLVAQNIDRVSRGVRLFEYYFKELGYVVSLGPLDAVGWLFLQDQIVSGLPAFAIKEVVEAQYDLFVAGLDTYII